jgi:hypothetical protein
MKTLFLLFVSVTALILGGCNEQPLISDEEYNRFKGPAPYSPDPTSHLPVQQNNLGR